MTKPEPVSLKKMTCDTPPPACLSHLEEFKIKNLQKKFYHALSEVLE